MAGRVRKRPLAPFTERMIARTARTSQTQFPSYNIHMSIVANADVPTTTYSYDNNGNLTQAGNVSYLYDYLNRITSIGFNSSTLTFAYDAFGSRVLRKASCVQSENGGRFDRFSFATDDLLAMLLPHASK